MPNAALGTRNQTFMTRPGFCTSVRTNMGESWSFAPKGYLALCNEDRWTNPGTASNFESPAERALVKSLLYLHLFCYLY
jgi:hypothetical protein